MILVNKDTQPPLCRLLSLDKWKYEQGKAEREAKKKQRESRCLTCHFSMRRCHCT